ncbi:unnamed protein product [Durusdinium trenchii]|uniref:Uncharacterized protein n=1 Tax=Durusdinium trenchii TaxID=1381693 RepID=A0ABP0SIW6_9DINO
MALAFDVSRLGDLRSPRKPEDPLLGRTVSKHPGGISRSSVSTCDISGINACKPEIHWLEELEDPQPSFDAELFPEPSEGDSDSDSTGSWLLSSWTGGALHMRSQKSDKYQD